MPEIPSFNGPDDTELQSVSGPPLPVPEWVKESWERSLEETDQAGVAAVIGQKAVFARQQQARKIAQTNNETFRQIMDRRNARVARARSLYRRLTLLSRRRLNR